MIGNIEAVAFLLAAERLRHHPLAALHELHQPAGELHGIGGRARHADFRRRRLGGRGGSEPCRDGFRTRVDLACLRHFRLPSPATRALNPASASILAWIVSTGQAPSAARRALLARWIAEGMVKSSLATGSIVDGFRIEECLHRGGMATLWRVVRPGADMPLLMKVPKLAEGEDPAAIVSFEMEQMILPRLQGAHVPSFVAAGDFAAQRSLRFGRAALFLLHRRPALRRERDAARHAPAALARSRAATPPAAGLSARLQEILLRCLEVEPARAIRPQRSSPSI